MALSQCPTKSALSPRETAFLVGVHAFLTLATNFPSGFLNATVNTAVVPLQRFIQASLKSRQWDVSENAILWIQTALLNIWFLGQVLGCSIAPYVSDHYEGYVIGIMVTCVGALLQAGSIRLALPELWILGRGLTAFVSPLLDACMIMYVQETTPLHLRGMISFFPELGYSSMAVLGSVLGMPQVLGDDLETLFFVSLIPEVVSLLGLALIPETPKHNKEKALKSLQFFQGHHSEDNERTLELFEYEKRAHASKERRTSVKEVLTEQQPRRAVCLGIAVFLLAVSYYPILTSSTFFFISSGFEEKFAEYASIGTLIVVTVANLIGAMLIDRCSRRKLILIFGILCNLLLIVFAISSSVQEHTFFSKTTCMTSVVLLVLAPLSWFMGPELVSQRYKSTVFAVVYCIGNVTITITNFFAVPLFKLVGGYIFIPFFIIPSAFCLLYICIYLPETLGKKTHEIVMEMSETPIAQESSGCSASTGRSGSSAESESES